MNIKDINKKLLKEIVKECGYHVYCSKGPCPYWCIAGEGRGRCEIRKILDKLNISFQDPCRWSDEYMETILQRKALMDLGIIKEGK